MPYAGDAENRLADLTLCLIVKNEAAFLPRCLAAAAPFCAETFIVDTGSVDGTQDIAKKFTDNVIESDMEGGYAAARNLALEGVTTPWVLFLDADEEFAASEWKPIAELIRNAPADEMAHRVLRYNLTAVGGFSFDRVVRLFRNDSAIRFRRRVGESVEDAVAELGGQVVNTGIVLNHVGGLRPAAERIAKFEKYLELCKIQVADYPTSGLWPAYAGFLLRSLGRFEEAPGWTERGIAMEPDSSRVWGYHGHVMRALDRRPEALSAFETAVWLDPSDAGFINMVGVSHLALNQLDEAEESFRRALDLEPELLHARINLALTWQARQEYARAAEGLRQVADRNPGMLLQDWRGRVEIDHFTYLFNETVPQFAGLAYHLGYCEFMAAGGRTESRYPVDPRFPA